MTNNKNSMNYSNKRAHTLIYFFIASMNFTGEILWITVVFIAWLDIIIEWRLLKGCWSSFKSDRKKRSDERILLNHIMWWHEKENLFIFVRQCIWAHMCGKNHYSFRNRIPLILVCFCFVALLKYYHIDFLYKSIKKDTK